jgi:hypothetical protein
MEQEAVRFVGVDQAKKSMEVCILARGMEVTRSSFSTDAAGREKLCAALQETDTIAVEACALAFVLERQLRREVGRNEPLRTDHEGGVPCNPRSYPPGDLVADPVQGRWKAQG